MFGYIMADLSSMLKEEKERYQAFYCGLCQETGERFGNLGKLVISYDMTFLIILLSSLYSMDEHTELLRCMPHPFKQRPRLLTPATEYASDLNIILAYYKCIDDINDDNSFIAGRMSKALEKHVPQIKRRLPRQCEAIEETMKRLSKIENANELNPDIPANCFGELMGELLIITEDEFSHILRAMGAALGRFVYIMDACNDLKSDIRKKRYNPLMGQLDTNFDPMLAMVIGECTQEFEKLPLSQDLHILRNILYSGVWLNHKSKKERDL